MCSPSRKPSNHTAPSSPRPSPGGPIVQSDLDRLIYEMLKAFDRGLPVDGACVILHGAMAGTKEYDPEGFILEAIRRALDAGPSEDGVRRRRPLIATLDLHAVLTDRMISAADVLIPFHTYPHTDQYTTGQRAARLLLRFLDTGDVHRPIAARRATVHPTVSRVKLPLLVRGDELLTNTGIFGETMNRCGEIEASGKGLAAGVIIGNPFTDVPDLRSNVLVYTNGDQDFADREAEKLADFMWRNRARFTADLTSIEDAIGLAESTKGLTVFSDAADATSSGASGDSNAVLRALLKAPFSGRGLVPIVDAPAAAAAAAAGVGRTIRVSLGGSLDRKRFSPLSVTARVTGLSDGWFTYEDGTTARAGTTAVLQVDNLTVLVTERPVYFVGLKVFTSQGLDPRKFDVIVVKSPNGFRTCYESLAARIIAVDAPGSTSANLSALPYRLCPRPIYPLDDIEER